MDVLQSADQMRPGASGTPVEGFELLAEHVVYSSLQQRDPTSIDDLEGDGLRLD
jgi:hypothetical protein